MASTPLATVLHSTLTSSRKRLIFASLLSNALTAWLMASSRTETEDGGHDISNPLTIGRNPNVTSYEYYGTLPVAQTNEFTTIKYNWSRVAGTVIISDQERDENRGPTQVFKLVNAKMEVLEESIKEKFSDYAYGSGAGTDPLGLAATVPDDPELGSLGGISRVTEPQWRTSSYPFAGTLNVTNIEEAFDDILMDLNMKNDRPNVIICGRNIMRLYRAAVRDRVVFALSDTANGGRMADLGFRGVTFQDIPMVYDEACPVNKAYFLNSKYMRMHMLRGVNMMVKELVAPWTQDATGRRVVTQMQLCLWRAYRTHAVLLNS